MTTNSALKNKILQLILLSCDVSPNVIRDYINTDILSSYNGNFKLFLNDKEIKHKLFHLYIYDVSCCECTTKKTSLRCKPVLNDPQFKLLYSDTGSKPHEKRKENNYITQHCICFLDPVASLDVLDISLMWILIHNCRKSCRGYYFIQKLKEIRNDVSHLPSFTLLTESDVDDKLKTIDQALVSLSLYITSGKKYFDAIKKQIQYAVVGTYQAADVQKIIDKGEAHNEVKISKIMEKIEETSKILKDHTTDLANRIIKEGKDNAKQSVDEVKSSVLQSHDVEMLKLGNIQGMQEVLLDMQMDQCDTIRKIDDITTDTHRQQVEQTEKITQIDEKMAVFDSLDKRIASKDQLQKLAEFSERVDIDIIGKSIVTIHSGLKENTTQTDRREPQNKSTQTGMEFLTSDFGNMITSRIKDVVLGEENIDISQLKTILMKTRHETENQTLNMISLLQNTLDDLTSEVKHESKTREAYEKDKHVSLATNFVEINRVINELKDCQYKTLKDIKQILKRVEAKCDFYKESSLQQDLYKKGDETKNEDLKLLIQTMKKGSVQTLLEATGFATDEEEKEFKKKMIDGTLEMDLIMKTEDSLVIAPKGVLILKKAINLPFFTWLSIYSKELLPGRFEPRLDSLIKFSEILISIEETFKKINIVIDDLWSKLGCFMSKIKSEQFKLILLALPNVVFSIYKTSKEIEKLTIENRRYTKTAVLKLDTQYIFPLGSFEINIYNKQFVSFLKSVEEVVNSICRTSSSLILQPAPIATECLKYKFLIENNYCKEVCRLFKEITAVKFVTFCYVKMSSTYLLPMIENLTEEMLRPRSLNVHSIQDAKTTVANITAAEREKLKEDLSTLF